MSDPPPIQRPPNVRSRADAADDTVPPAPSTAEAEAIERAQARLVEIGGASRSEEPALGATLLEWPGRGPAFNHATCLRWSDEDWHDRAAGVASRLRNLGEVPCLVVSDSLTTPPDVAGRLQREGWLEIGHEVVMWTRRAAAVPHLEAVLRLEAVTSAHIDEYETVERRIFGIAERELADRRAALAAAIDAGVLRVYLVREKGVPVATARLLVEDGLAGVHGLGVAPEQRRRGLGRYLTTIVTRAGLALGASLVWLSVDDANGPARALYGGLDYRPAFGWHRLISGG